MFYSPGRLVLGSVLGMARHAREAKKENGAVAYRAAMAESLPPAASPIHACAKRFGAGFAIRRQTIRGRTDVISASIEFLLGHGRRRVAQVF